MTRISTLFDAQRVIDAELAQDKKLSRRALALAGELEEMAIERRSDIDRTESLRADLEWIAGQASSAAESAGSGEAKQICDAVKQGISQYFDHRLEVERQQVEGFERLAEGQRRLAEQAGRHSDAVRSADGRSDPMSTRASPT